MQTIRDAVIIKEIDYRNHKIMDMMEFSDFFESHRVEKVNELVKDYQNIGDINLKAIEESTFKTATLMKPEMKIYYYYWERKIFNAIITMVIRALSTAKALLSKNRKPLIKMEAEYISLDLSYHPSVDELRGQLEKFNRNILESTKRFGRWWDGQCKCVEENIDKETSEKTIKYSFFDDVNQNNVITELNLTLLQLVSQIDQKFEMVAQRFVDKVFKYLFDTTEMNKMQKNMEKQGSVAKIEK